MDLITKRTKVKRKRCVNLDTVISCTCGSYGRESISKLEAELKRNTYVGLSSVLSHLEHLDFWVTVGFYSLCSLKLSILRLKPYNKTL